MELTGREEEPSELVQGDRPSRMSLFILISDVSGVTILEAGTAQRLPPLVDEVGHQPALPGLTNRWFRRRNLGALISQPHLLANLTESRLVPQRFKDRTNFDPN